MTSTTSPGDRTENSVVTPDPVSATPATDAASDPDAASTERPLTVVVLAGGISHERDVSLRSGRRVTELLQRAGHSARLEEPSGELLTASPDQRPDVYWVSLHGASGEDGTLQALLDLSGVSYVGTPAGAAALAWSKPTAKAIVARAGLATPEWVTLSRASFRELGANQVLAAVGSGFGVPAVVKPEHGGSAQGITIVTDEAFLPRAMVDAYTYSDNALIERHISGTELAITVVDTGDGPVALPPVEVAPVTGLYSFEARYNAGETVFYTPARCDDDVLDRAADAAVRIHDLLGMRELSRIDMIVDDAGTPWFLEANMLPGTTETSLMPLAIRAAGIAEADLYADLARAALRRG
ncbi:D-alanine--D-alanine ligase family protein [Mycetocola reblochoni]|uniref:D-alanine--D-alanine ligase n=2 Tax=Mycetocola reblochoni TaxID=331618 RepID=A0A1R4JNQ5_9MICO|nr:ATP-grasp domain-containing protein [Mycetocola reblochoni]RLP68625.1 ATP-grasp domain-containing protein [Mycetocola reblochoni]SJN33638.1 D-alanine--D-alanine ligase [Mycetocola reblochoni REB411]